MKRSDKKYGIHEYKRNDLKMGDSQDTINTEN